MAMNNPHEPEKALWEAYINNMNAFKRDSNDKNAKENADYYYDQWEKQCEKAVRRELEDKKIKAAADEPKTKKPNKIKPKPDPLKT